MPTRITLLFLLALCAKAPAAGAGGNDGASSIRWLASLDAALEDAKARRVPILVAVNMDGERANDELVAVHYEDPRIVELARRCACVFASAADHGSGERPCPRCGGPATCAEHGAIEKQVHGRYLQAASRTAYVAPEHLLLGPDGAVLLSVPYLITVGELEWCLADAIRAVDPAFAWTLAKNAKPPRRLVKGAVADPDSEVAPEVPSKERVGEILDELNSTPMGFGKIELLQSLLRSPDRRAIDYVAGLLPKVSRIEGRLCDLLRSIGRLSPPEYHAVVEPFVADERQQVKLEAIVALELLANPKSLPALNKAWKKDRDVAVQKELIRALAACGAADPATSKLVLAQAEGAKDPLLRVNALVGAAHLDDRAKVLAVADAAIAQTEIPALRFAAAYVFASLREEGRADAIKAASATERDAGVRAGLEACLGVLAGKPLSRLDPYLRDLAGSDVPRERL